MSATTGQRARFHINRKRRIAQRVQGRALMQEIASKRDGAAPAPSEPAEARKGPARRAKA